MSRPVVIWLLAVFFAQFPSSAHAVDESCSSISYPAHSGSKNNIVFTFDRPYPCGQYANGDWWVSAVDASGVVVIKTVAPVFDNGLNGLEVNPSSKNKQGFDKRVSGYDDALNVILPLRMKGDASIVKAVGISAEQVKCRPCLQFAAVLTVLKAPLALSREYLRPAYFGTEKTSYALPKSLDKLLPRHPVVCCSEAKHGDFENILRRYRSVQLDHQENWVGRDLHPKDNMPDYGASIATDNAVSILRFMLSDFNHENETHRMALSSYLQMGVDFQSMAAAGMKWPGAGGHGNGRKLPIIFTAHILGENKFIDSLRSAVFSEDQQIYFSKNAGVALYGAPCSDKDYWLTTRLGRGKRDCRDPYGFIDGGGHEIGSAYQVCCTAMPWKYTALTVKMLGMEREWAHDPFFEYVDRWVNHGVWAAPDSCAPYNSKPDDYLIAYGAGKDNNCIRGDGRYIDKHGSMRDGGHYRNKFGDQMWRVFRKSLAKDEP